MDGQDVEWPDWLAGPERLQRLDSQTLWRLSDAVAVSAATVRSSLPLLRQACQALHRLEQCAELDAADRLSTAQRGLLQRVWHLEDVDRTVDAGALARDVAVAVRLQTLEAAAGLLQISAGLAVAAGRAPDGGSALVQTVWLAAESAWLWQPPDLEDAEDVED